MKIKLFGCKDTTLHFAIYLKELDIDIDLITISPELGKKNDVAGYENLSNHKYLFDTIYVASSYNLYEQTDIEYFSSLQNCNLGLCVGWQRLIPNNVLEKFTIGIFGMHGSTRNLPFGKGRSPMNWSIIEGRNFFSTNLFKYNSGIDNGPVIDSLTFSINKNDTAETLHYKNTISMLAIFKKNLKSLLNNNFTALEQDLSNGETLYPKREPQDGIIDWRDDIFNIEKLIRGVTTPFYGAITYLKKEEIKIFRASIFYTDLEDHPFKNSKFGQVLDIFPNKKFLVRCSGGVLIIHEYNNVSISKGIIFVPKNSPFSKFKRNIYGFFDV